MHPAPSVIAFTTLSGLGFGLMFWLGLGFGPSTTAFTWVASIVAGVCAVGGLIASTFHLGHPERAIKAFSQWRSSWLSREGVLSVALLFAFGFYFLCWAFFDTRVAALGWVVGLLALASVYATSMIYAQLKTIPRWNSPFTSILYLAYALAGSFLLYLALKVCLSAVTSTETWIALMLMGMATIAYFLYQSFAANRKLSEAGTPETATGLGFMGKVSLLESPHSSPNYLMKEMVFQVGRRKALAISKVALILGFVVPLVLLALAALTSVYALICLAFVSHLIGVLASRWLFFAKAEHVVSLYYGHR